MRPLIAGIDVKSDVSDKVTQIVSTHLAVLFPGLYFPHAEWNSNHCIALVLFKDECENEGLQKRNYGIYKD